MTAGTPAERASAIRNWEADLVIPRIAHHLGQAPLGVLEVGAGTCENARRLTALGAVTAVEPFAELSPPPGIHFVRAHAEALPFEDASFDLVFSTSVLEHIEDLPRALREMTRVTRPSGLLVHVVPTSLWKLLAVVAHYGVLANAAMRRVKRLAIQRSTSFGRSDPGAWRVQAAVAASTPRWRPPIHGTSSSNMRELLDFRPSEWRRRFANAGLRVVEEQQLLAYSPPEFPVLPATDRLRRLGVASCVAFYLRPWQ